MKADSTRSIASQLVVGTRVDVTNYDDAVGRIMCWAASRSSKYVCVCNVHMIMEAYDDPEFRALVNGADLVTPDGMPVVWGLRLLGHRFATRVYGPDLMSSVCAAAERAHIPIGLYGGEASVLTQLVKNLREAHPALIISYAESPPFGPVETRSVEVERIADSGARVLLVALGCPKQERWMAAHAGRINAVMIGVGAAFDFLSGGKPQAPVWMRRAGLEWAFRLITEPRRLWRRYAIHNPRYLALLTRQFFTS